ncbi:MAG: hypothetical protein CMB80_01305 [Flammeovirgaceae bacterium]|nr:hypothetical protein [Flammeovirgaceae bacterium]
MTEETISVATRIKKKRRLRIAYNNSQTEPGRKIAAIRFSGVYLEDLGFNVGGYLDLCINDDKSITLRPVSSEQNDQDAATRNMVQKTGG